MIRVRELESLECRASFSVDGSESRYPDRASIDGRDEARFIAMKLDKNDWMSVGGLSGGIPVDGSESRYPGKVSSANFGAVGWLKGCFG